MIAGLLAVALAGELGFAPGEPLHTSGMKGPGGCSRCHVEHAEAWEDSGHRASWANDRMRAAFAVEPLPLCVRCHLPLPEQAEEVLANLDFYRSLDPGSELVAGTVAPLPEPRAARGIHCGTCHVRDGEILATAESGEATHGVVEAPVLGQSDFCISCHDFGAHRVVNGVARFTDLPMQATGAEWRAWRADGGQERCQDCHMPGGDHGFRGASDVDWLEQSVRVDRQGDRLVVRSVGVGHHLPTGDIFRHLTLEAEVTGRWVQLDWIGRKLATVTTRDGEIGQVQVLDTALRPGVPRDSAIPVGATAWRLRYHYVSDSGPSRELVDPGDRSVVLHDGSL